MSVIAYHFWSLTCGPCKVIKPALEDLKKEFPVVKWLSINTREDSGGYVDKLGVRVVPTVVVEAYDAQGKKVYTDRNSGTQMMAYYRIIRTAMKQASLQ